MQKSYWLNIWPSPELVFLTWVENWFPYIHDEAQILQEIYEYVLTHVILLYYVTQNQHFFQIYYHPDVFLNSKIEIFNNFVNTSGTITTPKRRHMNLNTNLELPWRPYKLHLVLIEYDTKVWILQVQFAHWVSDLIFWNWLQVDNLHLFPHKE